MFFKDIMKKKNVVGVGQGYKYKNGERTDELAMVVMVSKKVDKKSLRKKDLIPLGILGIKTDVIEVGELKALTTTGKYRPALGGVSVGHYRISAGTLGAVVRDRVTKEKLILSNNHVLAASNDGNEGDPILQPGPYDGGTISGDRIGGLVRFVKISFSLGFLCKTAKLIMKITNSISGLFGIKYRLESEKKEPNKENRVDAAVARPDNPDDVVGDIISIGKINGIVLPYLSMQVHKHGRTTDYTQGEIKIVNTTVKISYGEKGSATFTGQIITSNMSAGGDSGSLVLQKGTNKAVGLLFAGSDEVTILNPINEVLDLLSIEFNG